MADLLFIAITVAFFAIAVAFVQLCDKIIGPDSEQGELTESGETAPPVDPDTDLDTDEHRVLSPAGAEAGAEP